MFSLRRRSYIFARKAIFVDFLVLVLDEFTSGFVDLRAVPDRCGADETFELLSH